MEVKTSRVEKDVYMIPLLERFARIGCVCFKSKLMEVDGVGLYVYHSEEHSYYVTPGRVRRCWIMVRNTYCLIEADSEEEALREFAEEWEASKCGRKSPALRIDEERKIIRYPNCEHMHKNRRGEFVCGRPIHDIEGHEDQHDYHWNMNGERGMCFIDGYDAPDWCPIKKEEEA